MSGADGGGAPDSGGGGGGAAGGVDGGSSRTVGRVRVLQLHADPLAETPRIEAEGCELVREEHDGTVSMKVVDASGRELGVIRVHVEAHGDPFYGRYSRNDERYCYSSKLEIAPEARGRRLGRQLLRVARCVAHESGGRGMKSLVSPDNAVSLHCHDVEGFAPASMDLRGVRLGSRVLWLSRRKLS